MRALVLALSLSIFFPALAFPALSDDTLVWKSAQPTCITIYSDGGYGPKGYATVHRMQDGTEYRRTCDFLSAPRAAMSDIGWPADGSWPVNGDRGDATKISILPNGHIKISY